ncbi:MAG: AbgT family transporter, partial [Lachnospiraceae bacterium]|nr:AbgT family transporter [Lachnospiraceae bacterium]
MSNNTTQKKSAMDSFLNVIEKVCNKLPSPPFIFMFLFALVGVLSFVVSATGASVINPSNGEAVMAQNFLSVEGLHWFLSNMVKNFTGFAPLGLVITMTLGIGLCEESGLVMSLLRAGLSNVPPAIVPFLIAFIGTVGNIASDTANVIVPPVAGILFLAAGRHPVVGMICGYAGANAGFTANLMIAGTDSLLQGITNTAILTLIPDGSYQVDVTCNWFFMIASTFFCTVVIGGVVTLLVEPRFGKYTGAADEKIEKNTAEQSKGLKAAGLFALVYIIILLALFFTGPLAGENGAFIGSP